MQQWAFIYTLEPDSTEPIVATTGSDRCRLVTVGVPAPSDAVALVDDLIASGAELIELCGGFGPAETAAVAGAIRGRVPFGAVTYPCSEARGLHELFG